MTEEDVRPQSQDKKPEQIILDRLAEARRRIPPGKQFAFSVFATYVYMQWMFAPEKLPEQIQPMIEIFDKIPTRTITLWLATLTAYVGSVDGARRIVMETIPFWKAYWQVFVRGMSADETSNR